MAILPAEYQQVEYIESNGTQYIDTGFTPSVNTEINTSLSWGGTQIAWAVFFGVTSNDSSTDGILGRLYYDAGNTGSVQTFNAWFCNSTYGECQTSTSLDTFHKVKLKANYCTLDGASLTLTTSGTPYQGNIYLFCGNNGGSAWRHGNCKIKCFKIYESGTLVRDFVPCYRKSDGIIGLYDVVNSQFYTNSGTGTFVKGPDKVLKVKAVYLGNYRLPIGYREVEYIQSSGTQYIDTGISAPNGFKAIFGVTAVESASASRTVVGSHNISSPYGRNDVNMFTSGNTWGLHMNDEMINGLGSIVIGTKYEVECSTILGASYLKVGGVNLTNGSNTSPMSSNNVLIFTNQYEINVGTTFIKAKIYYCKIYNNSETLVRDLVPCYRGADGVIGMYDLVNDVFYTNAGTGTFTKGDEVKPYIKIRPKESGGILSGYWDYTTTSQATLQAEGWGGQGGGSWSVSGSGLTTSRSTTDRSYMVSLPIQINTKAKSIRIYGVINRTVGSWYGNFQWGIKATNTCGSGRDDYPADDWLIAQSVNCNSNSGYMGYGAGSSGSVLNCGLPGWNANLGYSGSDLAVETIIDIENGEISATWKSGNTTVQSGTATFDIATVKSLLSAVSTNQYLSIFTRNGTGNGKTMKNFGYEIIY